MNHILSGAAATTAGHLIGKHLGGGGSHHGGHQYVCTNGCWIRNFALSKACHVKLFCYSFAKFLGYYRIIIDLLK